MCIPFSKTSRFIQVHLRSRLIQRAITLFCFVMTGFGQTNETAKTFSKPDYSKEAFVIEEFSKEIKFAADGTWQAEQTAIIRVQSDAGIQQFGVLSFGYNRGNQKVDVAYIRARKSNGSVVVTPNEDVQDVSSEITRMAPTY